MIFTTEQRPDLPIFSPRLGYTIRFADGRYETDNLDEIRVLRSNPFVTAEHRPEDDPQGETLAEQGLLNVPDEGDDAEEPMDYTPISSVPPAGLDDEGGDDADQPPAD